MVVFALPGTGLVVVDVVRRLVERRLPELVTTGYCMRPRDAPCPGRARLPPYRGRVSSQPAPCRATAYDRTDSAEAGNRTRIQTQDDHAQLDDLQSCSVQTVQQQSVATAANDIDRI